MTKIIIPTKEINTTEDVIQFFQEVANQGIEIDVDGSFLSYRRNGAPLFTTTEAERLDLLMDDCFVVCHREQRYSVYDLTEFITY